MAGTKFTTIVDNFRKINSIEKIKIVDKKIPIGKKDGLVCYRNRKTVKISIDFTGDIGWLDDLGSNLTVQIGDTFYNKDGLNFKYDYLRQSSDYNSNLEEMVKNGEIYVMINNGLTNESC